MGNPRFSFNWKIGLLTAVTCVIVGIGLFVVVGSKLDMTCVENNSHATGCSIYRGFNVVTHAYGAFWLQFFAPRCVGFNTPDDCIGPSLSLMFWTLAGAGFIIGGTSKRKKPTKQL